jgi:hypothetical protein
MKKFSFVFGAMLVILLGISSGILSGCHRYKVEPTKALIRVVDMDGAPVKFSKVRIYALPSEFPPPSNAVRIDTCGVTSTDGSVEFDFSSYYQSGQAGFAVLDIMACKDGQYAEGIIKITEMDNNEETVTLVPGACQIPSDCE